jgi:hypothetical protein
MKRCFLFFVISLLFSCKKEENTNINTSIEYNAIQNVLNFYGGKCIKSKGYLYDNGNEKKYYEIEISNSELLNKKINDLKIHAANIAYLFYSNLDNDKDKYQEIKVKIVLNDGRHEEFSYLSDNLIEIENIQPILNQIIDKIKKKKYDDLITTFDKSINIEVKSLEDLFSILENQYGKIGLIQLQGFEFRKSNNYGEAIIINQAVIFGKTALSMNLIFKRKDNKLITIEFA